MACGKCMGNYTGEKAVDFDEHIGHYCGTCEREHDPTCLEKCMRGNQCLWRRKELRQVTKEEDPNEMDGSDY